MADHAADALFATTHWSRILAAQGEPDLATSALAELAVSYSPALRHYFAALAGDNLADDLVQEFLSGKFLRASFLNSVRPGAGRFRTFLKRCARNLWIDWLRRERTRQNNELTLSSLSEGDALLNGLEAREAAADLELDLAWREQLVARALSELEKECRQGGRSAALFTWFSLELNEEPGALSHQAVANQLGMTVGAVDTRFWRLRERLKVLLNEEIRQTVGNAPDWEIERAHLLELRRP